MIEDAGRFMVTTPTTNGERPLPRRVGTGRAPITTTWIGRVVEISYDGPGGMPAYAKGVLADYSSWGLYLRKGDATGGLLKIFGDRIATVELVGD